MTERVRGRKLQERRSLYFKMYPLCAACQRLGRVTVADELDHIKPLHTGGSDDPDNWQGLCKPCHSAKSAAESSEWWKSQDGEQTKARPASFPEWLEPASCDLTIIFGPPGSGKTTYAEEHSAKLDHIIDMDWLISIISGEPIYHGKGECVSDALRERNTQLGRLSSSNGAAWFVTQGAGQKERDWWIDKLRPKNVITLKTPLDECINRIKLDTRRPDDVKLQHIAAARKWWALESGMAKIVKPQGFNIDGTPISTRHHW
jgi:shikimate kinase